MQTQKDIDGCKQIILAAQKALLDAKINICEIYIKFQGRYSWLQIE